MPPFEPQQTSTARTRPRIGLHQVARSVAKEGRADSAEVGHDQLSLRSRLDRLVRNGVEDFGNAFALQDVDAAGVFRALDRQRSQLGHAPVIEEPRSPEALDSVTDRRDVSARFAGDDQLAHGAVFQIDPFLLGELGQAQRVRRRATDDRCRIVAHHLQAALARQTARRQTQRAEPRRSVKGGPKSEKRSEREGKGDDVLGRHSRDAIDLLPARDDPIPACRRVEPTQGDTRRAGRLMQPAKAVGRAGQVRAIGGRCKLIFDERLLGGQRQLGQVVERPQVVRLEADGSESLRPKRVAGQDLGDQLTQPRFLAVFQFAAVE